jgi:hypothetical protein
MADTAAMDVDAQQPQQAQAPAAQQQQQGKDGKKKEAKPSAEDNNNLKDGTVISRYKDASLIVNSTEPDVLAAVFRDTENQNAQAFC